MRDLTASQRKIVEAERQIWPSELAFSEEIYAERLAVVQLDLNARNLEGALLFDPENMFWLTGYQTIGYFTFQAMFVRVTGKPVIITRVVNRDMALALPTIGDAISVFDTEDHVDVLVDYLVSAVPRGQIGIETTSRYLNVHDHTRLSDQVGSRLQPFTGAIESHRNAQRSGRA